MDLAAKMQQIYDIQGFTQLTIESDVDPEDETTPGWTALVKLNDDLGGEFVGAFDLTPEQALDNLVYSLVEHGYIEDVTNG